MTSPIFIPCTGYTEKCTYTKLLNSKWGKKKKSFKPLSSLKTDTWPFISNSFCNTQCLQGLCSAQVCMVFLFGWPFFFLLCMVYLFFLLKSHFNSMLKMWDRTLDVTQIYACYTSAEDNAISMNNYKK